MRPRRGDRGVGLRGPTVRRCVSGIGPWADQVIANGCAQTEMKNMKRIRLMLCLLLFSAIATIAVAASAAAQTVVVGTSNPDIDVPAVQAAVDQGGEVILRGHFSFDSPPTVPVPALAPDGHLAMVLVSKAVAISGMQDGDDEETASIEAGTVPFYVDAPGASVEIQGLRFIRTKVGAIFVNSVSGLVIASCTIEGLEPGGGTGIAIITGPNINVPTPMNPGRPENISGTLWIVDNDLDLGGGSAEDLIVGVLIFSVGVPGAEVEAYISGNTIRNVTETAINIRRVVGRVDVERNVITTGPLVAAPPSGRPQAIRVANLGSYLIAHNWIDCEWTHPNAEGVGVFSQVAAWPMEGAVVVDNDVTMSAPEGTVFGDFSAAIGVFGFAEGNVVRNNRIRGRARAALSVPVFPLPPQVPAVPANNAFVHNHFGHFEASVADVFVGPAALNTRIVGAGTVEDLGTGTIIVTRSGEREGDHQDRDH